MKSDLLGIIAAIRAERWAILPEYLDAIEALALRAMESDVLARLVADGHAGRLSAGRMAVAATGQPLKGAALSMLAGDAAVIPVFGPIFPRATMVNQSAGGAALDAVLRDFRVAEASDEVSRIVMVWDSPGGIVSGLGEAADAIRRAAKPVTAFVTGIAASAAYWLASQAGEIVVERAGAVGSIGVVASLSRQEGPDADGRRTYEVVSSGAPRKRPDVTTDEGRAGLQEEVDALEAVFVADVARGRGTSAARVRAEFGQGGMVNAGAAVAAGMADRIGTLDGVLRNRSGRTGQNNHGPRRALAEAQYETRRRAAERF